ncbi:phosphoenolpyruvate--protein phosphotransferase [Thermodesulfatator autotrophicus]|uniref:Phosphoenolpyruvate-protein phosphotransferase n=1 Tax=Thermodesulfatator autotrophicus TaxID=1795632 RepID=A0A177E8K2_9BACT|nr:phosphoenolpyruvate--protein phosphotransferase [Thermodesulfatator autotrophicus]OAG28118.1 hypothetical protein TH606_03540 [Thermodesulfatator autotrophicus]
MKRLKGIGVSPGVAIGPAYILLTGRIKIARRVLRPEQIEKEIARFHKALATAIRDLEEVKRHIPLEMTQPLSIIDAHILMLKDPSLIRETENFIRRYYANAEWALRKVLDKYQKVFSSIGDFYLKERIQDLEHLIERVILALKGKEESFELEDPAIVVARDLSPADTARLKPETTHAFVTEMGSRTSHTAIVARSLGIPAVVAVKDIMEEVSPGDLLIVDGLSGDVIINPSQEVIEEFLDRRVRCEEERERLLAQAQKPAITRDGHKVTVKANLELLDEIPLAIDFGAEGVGLFRTEYLYVVRKTLPGEEELFANYRQVVESLYPHTVTFRTLDLGGDKFAEELDLPAEINPALGLRAIRLCLKNPALFKVQLRALLRASAYGNVRIMFPLISGIEELREAKKFLQEVYLELKEEGFSIELPPCGAMIEIPTAVFIADHLAKEVDFFSIGTNDLIQYALAIDRGNEQVAHLYEPLHPGILRMIDYIVKAGHKAGIQVAMCGEMAGELLYLPLLIGFGFDELSMNPQSIPAIKDYICSLSFKKCRQLCEEVIDFSSAREVKEYLENWLGKEGLLS